MKSLRSLGLCLIAAGCAAAPAPLTAADHDRRAQHYAATADSIELECWKARRTELTVDAPASCWKSEDLRFLEANRNAAARHRVAAGSLRSQTALR
jgi:hypothetical protein